MKSTDMDEQRSIDVHLPRVTRSAASSAAAAPAKLRGEISVQPIAKAPLLPRDASIFGRRRSWADQIADDEATSKLLAAASSATAMSQLDRNYRQRRSTCNIPAISAASSTASFHQTMDSSGCANPQVKFVNSTLEILQSQMKKEDGPKKKRMRTSPEQLKILQKAFNQDPMPNSAARSALAQKLGMKDRAVQVWFQNRRAKGKLDQRRQEMCASALSGAHSSGQEELYMDSCSAPYHYKMAAEDSMPFAKEADQGISQTTNSIPHLPRSQSLPMDFSQPSCNGYISSDGRFYSSLSNSSIFYNEGDFFSEYASEFQNYSFPVLCSDYSVASEVLYQDNFDFSMASSVPVETDVDGTLKIPEDVVSNSFPFFDKVAECGDSLPGLCDSSGEYYPPKAGASLIRGNPLGVEFDAAPLDDNQEYCHSYPNGHTQLDLSFKTQNQPLSQAAPASAASSGNLTNSSSGVLRRCFSSPDVHYYLNASQIEQLQQFDREAKMSSAYYALESIQEEEQSEEGKESCSSELNNEAFLKSSYATPSRSLSAAQGIFNLNLNEPREQSLAPDCSMSRPFQNGVETAGCLEIAAAADFMLQHGDLEAAEHVKELSKYISNGDARFSDCPSSFKDGS